MMLDLSHIDFRLCVNPDCERELDMDDMTVCSECYMIYGNVVGAFPVYLEGE